MWNMSNIAGIIQNESKIVLKYLTFIEMTKTWPEWLKGCLKRKKRFKYLS